MRITRVIAIVLGSLLQISCVSNPLTSSEGISSRIAQQASPAVVLIKGYKGNTLTKQGSGFLVGSDGRIATNRHVIEGADSLEIQLANGEIYDRVFFLADDIRRDLALLRIPANNLSVLRIANEENIAIGDRIYVIGNPMGFQGTFSDGLVSAKRMVEGVSIIQISAPISPGSSGGPVLNEKGEVIGVATLSLQEAQNLNIAIPARYIEGLLSIGSTPALFTDVADRFANNEALASASEDTQFDDLEPWAKSLVLQVAAVMTTAEKIGYEQTHKTYYETAKQEELYTVEYKLDASDLGKEFHLVAVCDSDCTDINLGALDPNGNPLAADTDVGEVAEIGFIANLTGTYKILVAMPKCATTKCGFAIQSYEKK